MRIDIEKIYTYGRFYPDIEEHVHWWLCVTNYKIYDTATILSDFGYADEQEISDAGVFIPLFKTNIVELEKRFLHTVLSDSNKVPFSYDDITFFDKNFKIYIEAHGLIRDWYDFEKNHLCNDAIAWCKMHNIHFH